MALDINQRTETHTPSSQHNRPAGPQQERFFVIKEKRYIIPSSHPLEAFKKREMYLELYRQTSSYLFLSCASVSLLYIHIVPLRA